MLETLNELQARYRSRRIARTRAKLERSYNKVEAAGPNGSRHWLSMLVLSARQRRYESLLRESPRDWRVGIIDGGVVYLKNVTREQALEKCASIRYAVRYVDDEQAFIAAADPNAGTAR